MQRSRMPQPGQEHECLELNPVDLTRTLAKLMQRPALRVQPVAGSVVDFNTWGCHYRHLSLSSAGLIRREKRGEIVPEALSDNSLPAGHRNRGARNSARRAEDQPDPQALAAYQRQMDGCNIGRRRRDPPRIRSQHYADRPLHRKPAVDKPMTQLRHNIGATASRCSALSITIGGGKWVEINIHADPLCQQL